MGKISDALNKYAKERRQALKSRLTRSDVDALLQYDRESGHLLQYDPKTGEVDLTSMQILRNKGTIQRLLDNKLIFPSGQLTQKGLQECERLAKLMKDSDPPPAAQEIVKENGQPEADKPLHAVTDVEKEALRQQPVQETEEAPPMGLSPIVPPVVETVQKVRPLRSESAEKPEPEPAEGELPSIETISEIVDKEAVTILPDYDTTEIHTDAVSREADTLSPDDDTTEVDAGGKSQEAVTESSEISSDATTGEPKSDEGAVDEKLVSLLEPQSYEAEQFKILRTNILYPVSGTPPQSILVTSAIQGEGKSFVSSNLAISIAMNVNKHVLLIDCDLRKPDIHRRFGFDNLPGLSDYLTDHSELASMLVKTGIEKLTLLPGGTIPPNPSEIMSSEKMAELLEEVKYRYQDRLIVIDSPPPSMAAETSFLARHVDSIIVVSRHGKTPREDLEDLIDRMGSEKILGTVVNFTDARSKYYGYRRYGFYGRRYGYGQKKR